MNKRTYALIVDDNLQWIAVFRRVLGSYYEPLEAHSVEEAIRAIEEHSENIGIAIVDIRLGDEINYAGIDVVIALRPYGIRAVAVSAYGDPTTVRRAFVQGNLIDFCFKDGDNLVNDLRSIVTSYSPPEKQVKLATEKVGTKKTSNKETANLWRIFGSIFIAIILVFGTLTIVAQQISPDILGIVIGAGIFLVVIFLLSALLIVKQISRKDFKDLFKSFTKEKNGK